MESKPKYWFKRRRYGFGWIPVTREGWFTVVGFLAVIVGAAVLLLPTDTGELNQLQLVTFFLSFLSAISFMIGISYAKGPAPRWRWGKSPDDNPDEDF